MSWQDYVDKQLLASKCVTKAAIAGHDGNVWAKSDDFLVTLNDAKEDTKKLGIILKCEEDKSWNILNLNVAKDNKNEDCDNLVNIHDTVTNVIRNVLEHQINDDAEYRTENLDRILDLSEIVNKRENLNVKDF
ncbi:unnamed protein product [Psylliodes chrysocephalus]|uniref:Profilin n=1 Tax=Psylliodes chrysocephalus TaxID=3402493 RepID=A0A9P0GK09_9CUCU|nr:unnamed protein product [Psylliodes chrysocephala]